eukprot:7265724-Ditylum_brightwellii.AAC.1
MVEMERAHLGKCTAPGGIRTWTLRKPMQKGKYMLKWCTNNCHACPMWCGQNKCLPCKEYQKKREKEGKGGTGNEQKKRDDFKVALSAFKEQFLN